VKDDRRPVLVGAAQLIQRDVDLGKLLSPLDMLEAVATSAAEDAGAGRALLERVDTLATVDGVVWRPKNAPGMLAERLGLRPRREWVTAIGGEMPLVLVNHLAREIAAGRVGVALVACTHTLRSYQRAQRARQRLDWPKSQVGDAERIGENRRGSSQGEVDYGLRMPTEVYPIFENALRARRGLDLDAHRSRIGQLMSRFSKVAAENPYAWFPVERSAEEIATSGPGNRMIAFPYTKYMNAVMETDQAAALLLTSAQTARELGIADSRMVHWWGGASANEEQWYPSERPSFSESAAMKRASRDALSDAGVDVDELAHLDLYSCFPVAVELGIESLGLGEDDPRGFTVTGGLPYAGGPGNGYTLHALATMVAKLRDAPGEKGLLTGNGWYLTKHAATVLASAPRQADGWQEQGLPVLPRVPEEAAATAPASGEGRLEAYTVLYDRDGAPTRGIVLGSTSEGRRFVANTPDDRELLESFAGQEEVGRAGVVRHEDGFNVFDPS
jgi:acetyl-CoA C-acetyltransferase